MMILTDYLSLPPNKSNKDIISNLHEKGHEYSLNSYVIMV